MFVRIDKDLVVNMNQITSYNILEDYDSYKLVIYKNDKTPFHTVFYMKNNGNQVDILLSFINAMNEVIVNPENMKKYNISYNVPTPTEHIEEELKEETNE